MKNKTVNILKLVIVLLALCIVFLTYHLTRERQANEDMKELAALEKTEMENEYEQFANQYSEMKTRINNDSIIAQLTREQKRTQELLEELRKTKSDDAAEITRLKKKLATVRAVLRSYVLQIDSLNRLNAELMNENVRVKSELEQSNLQNQELATNNQSLSEKVAIASQLNATNLQLRPVNKNGQERKSLRKARALNVTFSIARNVTASNGHREVYVRITTPQGEVLNGGGAFGYEQKQLAYSMKKSIEYTGEETAVSLLWPINQTLTDGTYNVSVFVDGNMIGAKNFILENK